MMGKDERECVKLPFGEYLKVPDDNYPPPKREGVFFDISEKILKWIKPKTSTVPLYRQKGKNT